MKLPYMEKIKTFVIHVRGNKERENHIRKELGKHCIEFEFILDGNKEDIPPFYLEKYFRDDFKKKSPQTSCVLKHLLAYEKIVENKIPMALIFEDDIELFDSFQKVFEQSVIEAKKENLTGFIISYESSNQKFISKSEEEQGKYVYLKNHGRCAGAYLVDLKAAITILENAEKQKCNMNVDWFHNELSDNEKLKIYWCHPPIAEQQSHSGKVQSLLDEKKQGRYFRIKYLIQKKYKEKILSRLR